MKWCSYITKSLLLFLLIGISNEAKAITVDGINYRFNETNKTCTVIDNESEYTGDIKIPSVVNYLGIDYDVTIIGESAFSGCSGLASITIPNSVTSIGNVAFSHCTGLTSVTIPNSVTSIGYRVFSDCSNLTTVEINSNEILSKNYKYGDFYAISSNFGNQVQKYVIGNDVEGIGDYAFSGCSGMTSIVIPSSVTNIGKKTFSGCIGLTTITIPNSVTSIGSYAFDGCSGLTSITIPNSVTSIGSYAFNDCTGLTSVTIPSSVTSIGSYAFNDCTGLTSVTIPSSVTNIGSYAFDGCSGLEKVVVKDLAAWCNISFGNSFANPLYNAKHLYSDENTEITDLVIPNSVTSIGSCAFNGCSGLTSVTIPNSVTSIGTLAFYGCTGLTSVNIPNSVTSIGGSAFYKCTGLNSVTIPSSVTSIDGNAFSDCTALPSITIPNNVTTIGIYAFDGVGKVFVNKGTTSLLALWNAGYTPNQIGTDTSLPAPELTVTEQTQATLSCRIDNWYDDYKFYCDGYTPLSSPTFVQKNLAPNSKGYGVVVLMPGTDLDNYWRTAYYDFSSDVKTLEFTPSIAQAVKTASSFHLKGMYSEGDAVVTKEVLSMNGQSVEGSEITITGLKPNTRYSAEYKVTITYGGGYTKEYRNTSNFVTDQLTFTTRQPKVVSSGNVIVSADANIDEAEENAGFEWRRTDWTDDFISKKGTGIVFEGTMEGYIRNLNAEKLWKYRPYYTANDGTSYYGDWIGIDPTDFSYYEPTVHTYADVVFDAGSAKFSALALPGTDAVLEQGFEYWVYGANQAKSLGGVTANNIQKVVSSGQRMTATVNNLQGGATYHYRAYVTTASGTTYGEEQEFTMPATTGIATIDASDISEQQHAGAPKGIFTLTGAKVSDDTTNLKTLPRGIYIVNGRKMVVK